jgi:CDP-diacylglycerol--glycerol-3-phosphate 3-phosphatidyltransferase
VTGLLLGAGQTMYAAGRDLTLWLLVVAFVVFLLAALTDWLDGAMARKLNAQSTLGAALDHAADKALTTATLIALAATALPFDLIAAAAIIVTRDVAIGGLREGLSLSGRAVPVSSLGKWKTAAIMIGVGAAIAMQIAALAVPVEGRLLEPVDVLAMLTRFTLWAAAALALWSGAEYAHAALRKA